MIEFGSHLKTTSVDFFVNVIRIIYTGVIFNVRIQLDGIGIHFECHRARVHGHIWELGLFGSGCMFATI